MKNMIVFDLDGTLWDTSDSIYQLVNNYLKENGYTFEVSKDVIIENMGYEFDICAHNYFPKLEKKEAMELLDKIYDESEKKLEDGLEIGKIYPGVFETIKKLAKKYYICIVTNCPRKAYVESFIRSARVEEFITDYYVASSFFISKAEAIRKLQDKYHAEKVVYVGDSMKDQISAVDSGGTFVLAKYGFGEDMVSKYAIDEVSDICSEVTYIFEE